MADETPGAAMGRIRIEHPDGAFIERTGPASIRSEVPEEHMCGLQGFGREPGDRCPACDRHKALRLELQAREQP